MDIEQNAARWDAEEQAVRARLSRSGNAAREQIIGRTGMEFFEAIFSGELPPAPIGDTPLSCRFTWSRVPLSSKADRSAGTTTRSTPCMADDVPDLRSTSNNLGISHAHP